MTLFDIIICVIICIISGIVNALCIYFGLKKACREYCNYWGLDFDKEWKQVNPFLPK